MEHACRFEADNIILLHDQQPHLEYLPTKVHSPSYVPLHLSTDVNICLQIADAAYTAKSLRKAGPGIIISGSVHLAARPTKRRWAAALQANILAAIAWMVRDCQASDSLFFGFSGHGCQPPHQGGGSWDEGILPCDFQQACI